MGWDGMGWVWFGLDWIGLVWIGLDWIEYLFYFALEDEKCLVPLLSSGCNRSAGHSNNKTRIRAQKIIVKAVMLLIIIN